MKSYLFILFLIWTYMRTHAASVDILQVLSKVPKTQELNPLECCDISQFLQPSAMSKCDFNLIWDADKRLKITNQTGFPFIFTLPTEEINELKVLPETCEKENCVFEKLKIVDVNGKVDTVAFSKLLDATILENPTWRKAKARVTTNCLVRPITDYEAGCEINQILSCTFDVLSENCPKKRKPNPCKHKNAMEKNVLCQISSSKMRPKNRRPYCELPRLIPMNILAECGLTSITILEYNIEKLQKVERELKKEPYNSCIQPSESTMCLLNQMDVLNKYGFIDHLKMKRRIYELSNSTFGLNIDIYLDAFNNALRYTDYCSVTKKLLNVIEAMITTCPIQQQSKMSHCQRLFPHTETAVKL